MEDQSNKEVNEPLINYKTVERYIGYGTEMVHDFDNLLKSSSPEGHAHKVKNRFINFGDEGYAIKRSFEKHGRDEVLNSIENHYENGEYLREEFERVESHLEAVCKNLEEIMDSFRVPKSARNDVYEGIETMKESYNPLN